MSTDSQKHKMHNPELLPIEFVVVGGSVSGMCSAIALSRVGHSVTVFEALPEGPAPFDGGVRLAPNATKILYRWGMEDALKEWGTKSLSLKFANFESGDSVATHDWEEELLEETGGDFLLIHNTHLRRVLTDCAIKNGVKIRYASRVVKLTPDRARPSVTIQGGEVVSADVVVLSDGRWMEGHFSRTLMLDAIEQEERVVIPRMQFYSLEVDHATVKGLVTPENFERLEHGQVVSWYSNPNGAMGYFVRGVDGKPAFITTIYTASATNVEFGIMESRDVLLDELDKATGILRAIAKLSPNCVRAPLIDESQLEEWVHPDGRVIAIGDACHPMNPGTVYPMALACGDGAALGQIFSHLQRYDQIDFLLQGVQTVREPRIEQVMRDAMGNIFAVAMPPGVAEQHDSSLQTRANQGVEARTSKTSAELQDALENIFGYDPEDEAESWWLRWGLMQEHAARTFSGGLQYTMQVETDTRHLETPSSPTISDAGIRAY